MKYLVASIFIAAQLSMSAAAIVYPRQAVPRSNQLKIGQVTLSIDKSDLAPSGWHIDAQYHQEKRTIPVTPNSTDRIIFPDVVLEVRNWNIPGKKESWNILQETIGDYEIKQLSPAEMPRATAVKESRRKEKADQMVLLDNGILSVGIIPAINGVMPLLLDGGANGENLLNSRAALENGLEMKSFQNVGFIELFNSFGNTPTCAMSCQSQQHGVVLQGESTLKKGVKLSRAVVLSPEGPLVTIRSQVSGGEKPPLLKHRPEFKMLPFNGIASLSLLLPEDSGSRRLHRVAPRASAEFTINGNGYAVCDCNRGLLLCVVYKDHPNLYIWMDSSYMSLEAAAAVKGEPLEVSYFLVHGLSSVDLLGEGLALACPTLPSSIFVGEALTQNFALGSAIALKNPQMTAVIRDSHQKAVATRQQDIPAPAAGYATEFAFVIPTAGLPVGKYTAEMTIRDAGSDPSRVLLQGQLPITILSTDALKAGQDYLKQLEKQLEALRKKYRSSNGSRETMIQFRKAIRKYNALKQALKDTALDEINRLLQD